jgi:hypothetical protein
MNELKVMVEWLTLLLHIWEVPGSNSARRQAILRFSTGFLSPSRQIPECCLTFRYDSFFAHPRHFIFTLSTRRSVL